MAINHLHRSWLAFAYESTQGVVITDWDGDGFLVDHLEADPGAIAQSLIEDATLNFRAFTKRRFIKGIRNNDNAKFKLNWHGSEAVTANAAAVAQTSLMKLTEHCWGGQVRTKSTTCTGGTALIPELTSVDTITPGTFIAFEDLGDLGRCHIRRVLVVTALAVTLDQALPFTPANGDKAHGCAITYIDEDVLGDSTIGNRTLAWRLERSGTEAVYEFVGTKAMLGIMLPRNAPPSLELSVYAANFEHETLTKETWTQTPAGQAPLAIGRDTKLFVQVYGTHTSTDLHCQQMAVEAGVPVVPIDTITEVDDRMEGRAGYSIQPADTTLTPVIVPFDDDWEVALQADTSYKVRYSQIAQAGKCWAVHCSRAEIGETPKFTPVNSVQGVSVKFRAHEDLENEDAANAALWRSKIILVQA